MTPSRLLVLFLQSIEGRQFWEIIHHLPHLAGVLITMKTSLAKCSCCCALPTSSRLSLSLARRWQETALDMRTPIGK